ncbi:hypothetical protein Pmani_020714 [Petrolisthes manimaculis]|uniref:Uncharacterized protein n=1 Tax=Petrolisthes manimaculis TaxID=1843537 RepID=A0AAE1PHW8_9EUCA|nr:hypothetical protein Pmani_020714 [Petrolisthes manimaculis]
MSPNPGSAEVFLSCGVQLQLKKLLLDFISYFTVKWVPVIHFQDSRLPSISEYTWFYETLQCYGSLQAIWPSHRKPQQPLKFVVEISYYYCRLNLLASRCGCDDVDNTNHNIVTSPTKPTTTPAGTIYIHLIITIHMVGNDAGR